MKTMLFALLAGSIATISAATAQESEIQRTRRVLESSAQAYKGAVALHDKLVVTAPGSEQETKSEEYAFGPNGAVWVKNGLLEVVAVDAVNTLEQGPDTKEKLERVRRFWKSQGFTMPTLLDAESKMFKAYGNLGLPSVALVSPDGTILRYHEGVFAEMEETLKREV